MKIESKKPELRPIDTIKPYPLNAKKHGDDQVKRLAQSITRFGWRGNPIIVDSEGVIIAGHGRRLAALLLGMTAVPVIVESDMAAEEARAFRLADNRVALSDIDSDILQEELLDLGDFGDLLDGIFDKKELDFALADIMTINEGAFVDDLNSVMDDAQATTSQKIDASDVKQVSVQKALGVKTVSGKDVLALTRFMAILEDSYGGTPEEALVKHARDVIEGSE